MGTREHMKSMHLIKQRELVYIVELRRKTYIY